MKKRRNLPFRVKEVRKEKGYTQEYVADALGMSKKTYQQYEASPGRLRADMLLTLSELYGCSVDYLVGTSGIRNIEEFEKFAEGIKALL